MVIECARRDGAGRSGITGGLLTAAWLAYCMEWRAPGEELVRSRDGWKLTLRAGQKGQSREVVILIKEVDDEASAGSLSSIRLVSGTTAAGTFLVRRTGPDTMTTVSETPLAGISERTIYSANPGPGRSPEPGAARVRFRPGLRAIAADRGEYVAGRGGSRMTGGRIDYGERGTRCCPSGRPVTRPASR